MRRRANLLPEDKTQRGRRLIRGRRQCVVNGNNLPRCGVYGHNRCEANRRLNIYHREETMKAWYPFIRYVAICVLVLLVLTLSACEITAANRSRVSQSANTPEPSSTPERPTATVAIPSSTPTSHNTTVATTTAVTSNLWPGFTTTITALAQGFPILPQAQFVAYNPAYDPCAVGNRGCAVRAFPSQVWLYEVSFPPDSETIGRSVADEYTKLLEAAGYQVDTTLSDDATRLTFTGPTGAPARHGFIEVGPSVRPITLPLGGRIIGIRIVVDRSD